MSDKKKDEVAATCNQDAEEAVQFNLPVEEGSLSAGQMCRVAFCSGLNLRKAPGMHSPVLQVLPAGTALLIDPLEWVADGTGVWFPVTIDGVNGFVNGQYLVQIGC
ncbi:hypothetical protein B5E56_01620 [Flavonifractor sp. An112]|uniref:SH3 domain-containing protein n=1 Tax=Flavonifractor sp. An112 TaxID=1965544 RepID=UPI000B39C4CD|nr:SH3 domain-containing protein [Flavonifractor sp. An112]OUQ61430.1 hypothetical protein B5E56_01620 [Flavonifractor sp. An112]